MLNLRGAAILLGFSAAAALLGSPPAQAGPNPPLANCVPGATLSSLFGGGCTRGDKNFTFSAADYTGSLPADEVFVSITGSGDSYTVNLQADSFWVGTGSMAYTVAVNNRSTDLLRSVTGAQQTSIPGSLFTGNTTASGANPGTCGSGPTAVTAWSCATSPLTYPFGLHTTLVTNAWDAPTGVTQLSNTISQQPVPGPLPLLGAATLFGFSRKLRRRIQTVHG